MSPRRRREPPEPTVEVGVRVCAPDVPGLDPFTECVVTSAPKHGRVDLEEVGGEHNTPTGVVHKDVPTTHLAVL